MKTLFIILSLLFCSLGTLIAQSPIGKGEAQINFGLGLTNWGIPIYGGFDVGVHRDFTLGAEVSYRGYEENFGNNRFNHGIIGVSGNGNYHFNTILELPKAFDFYGGANIGYFAWSSPSGYNGNRSSGLGLGFQIGGRYFFNEKIGANLEFGGGNAFSGGKIGLTIKL